MKSVLTRSLRVATGSTAVEQSQQQTEAAHTAKVAIVIGSVTYTVRPVAKARGQARPSAPDEDNVVPTPVIPIPTDDDDDVQPPTDPDEPAGDETADEDTIDDNGTPAEDPTNGIENEVSDADPVEPTPDDPAIEDGAADENDPTASSGDGVLNDDAEPLDEGDGPVDDDIADPETTYPTSDNGPVEDGTPGEVNPAPDGTATGDGE